DGRTSDATFRREERDDLAATRLEHGREVLASGTATAPREHRRRRGLLVAGALHLLDLVYVTDGVHELVGGERLHEELASAREHRAAKVVLLALDAHHDDRR